MEFLNLVGLPPVDPRCILGPVLDSRYRDSVADSDAKIRDGPFFQLSSSGWRKQNVGPDSRRLVCVSVNLPNGTAVFHRAVLTIASAPSDYAEEVFEEAVNGSLGGIAECCAGIVADRFRSKALLNLENRHRWMVNLSCQVQAIARLVKDFASELTLFENVVANCFKLATYFNKQSQVRVIFNKYQVQESDGSRLLRAPADIEDAIANFGPVFSMLDDVMGSIGPLQLAVLDEGYKVLRREDQMAVELAELIQDVRFWSDVEAVHSIVKMIGDITCEMETERPLVGQCLPLWNELRAKIHDWCNKFSIEFAPVGQLIERRFQKNYHPAWSAAFILDPLYLIKDASGKYLPPFKLLTPEQEKDVDKLITRLVSSEEAHIVLMELMKWRTEGLDPLYAQAVQVKHVDPLTGKMRIANPQSSRLVWETCLSEFKILVGQWSLSVKDCDGKVEEDGGCCSQCET
ncbi:uncharacterized protein A4U43_C09F7810 [Asparagus officinalis]|uniref:Uncharacterized protein n=1 Tax=Asparagus officinalis TaxID=4686 RepID=A0A5P1E610_ASPOF|nr:uncharacterized protein A4U43_C09F7810 [Asparagus officinalis]